MTSLSSLRFFGGRGDGDYKTKISTALKEIETQRRELENIKGRLAERRQKLFDAAVRALQEKNKSRALVYTNEHTELRKVTRVVEASELALTQVSLRLQSITEIGDAMFHMNSAFKSIKSVSKTMEGMMPALDAASTNINNTLTETMAQMGQISPNLNIDVRTENSEELIEQARRFADEQAESLKQSLHLLPERYERGVNGDDILLGTGGDAEEESVPLLATGDDDDEETPVIGTMYSAPKDDKVEGQVLRYASKHDGVVDVLETATDLGLPQDEVEFSTIRLIAQGKVKTKRSD